MTFSKQIVVVEESCLVQLWDEDRFREAMMVYQRGQVDPIVQRRREEYLV